MAAPANYNTFDLWNVGEPLTPYLQIMFRGDWTLHTYPNNSNKIYVEDATFSVLDDNGYSSASITLCDPDFVNLENIFLKAVFLANSMTIGEGCWFCKALWGWSTYTKKHINDNTTYKTSSMHYYMLKDITYDLTDVELRIKIDLMDIGHSAFAGASTEADKPKITVGKLRQEPGVTLTVDGKPVVEPTYMRMNATQSVLAPQSVAKAPTQAGLGVAGAANTLPDSGASPPVPKYDNVLSGKTADGKDMTYWEAIKIVMGAQGFVAEATAKQGCPPEPLDKPIEADGKIIIPVDAGFKETIDDLIKKIAPIKPDGNKPGRHWGILAGGRFDASKDTVESKRVKVLFGWIPDPPKGGSTDTSISQTYRLARRLVYRPSSKEQISSGQTQINSLTYNWTSRGAMAVGLPNVYGIGPDRNGKMKVWTSEEDYKAVSDKSQFILGGNNPTVKSYTMQDLQKLKGVKVNFNFDTRNASKELIDVVAGNIVINMWNFFLSELVEITVDIPGDPWLDNTLFTSDGKPLGKPEIDQLVDLYNCWFSVTVYKPGVGATNVENPVLSGKYLCLKGCSHHIAEGEYTTTLSLMKAF